MSGLLLKSLRPALTLSARRGLPLSCSDFEPVRIERAVPDNKHNMLKVRWEDGIEGQYPYIWLQDCAPPDGWSQNYLGTDPRPLPLLAELNLAVKPEVVEILPIGQGIMVQWPPYNKVNYPSSWLRQHFRSNGDDTDLDKVQVWDRNDIDSMGGIHTVQASVNIAKHLPKIKSFLISHGIVRVKHGISFEQEILSGLGVSPREDKVPIPAMCFTKSVNDMHTGVPFCDPVPNLATLGFLKKPSYGQLQLVDGFMVAKKIRSTHPFTFRYLCNTKINYGNLDRRCEFDTTNPFDNLVTRKNQEPVFILKEDGLHVDKVVFSNPCRSSRQEVPPDTMHEFYGALKLFNTFCYDPANLLNIAPEEGDLYLMDNGRILHGTTAFSGTPAQQQVVESFYHCKL